MSETTEERWYRWDVWANEGKFDKIIKEFDEMVKNYTKFAVGDLVRRNDALEMVGIEILKTPFKIPEGKEKWKT